MIPRILEKDVRVALQKLEKLHLDQIRNLTKDFGSSKDKENCEKCEQILGKLFPVQDSRSAVNAISAKNEEEKLEQKLETIEERPLVETGGQSLDFPPKVLGQNILPSSDIQWRRQNTDDKALDEIARRLMSFPPHVIDRRILEAYNLSSTNTNQMEKGEFHLISANNREVEMSENDNEVLFDDVISSAFPGYSQEYSVDIVDEISNRMMEVERPHPAHYDIEYVTYIEKGTMRRKVLRDLEDLGAALVPQNELMMVPLPPNVTAISSYDVVSPDLEINEEHDKFESTSISAHTLGKKMTHSFHKDRRIIDEHVTYFSTLSTAMPIEKMPQIDKKADIDRVPLSELLKWARQRSMAENEKKDHAGTYLSKGTCLPPLDFRPRSKTCPPRPCPVRRKKEKPRAYPCQPLKKSPCPPPKKSPCPPPKSPCTKSPCDPCKPPPRCPPRGKPCNLIIGNRIKETISLILSAYKPLSPLPLLPCPKERCISTAAFFSPLFAATPSVELKRVDDYVCSEYSPPVEAEGSESVALSRSFDPWTPIPSWPIPRKQAEKRLICPKEGCPPPKPLKGPCKEQPCDISKRRKITAVSIAKETRCSCSE